MNLKESLRELVIKLRMKTERGQSWFNFLKTPVILAAGLKVFGLPDSITLILGCLMLIVFYTTGHLDYKYGVWLRENEVRTRDYNQYFKDLEDKIE